MTSPRRRVALIYRGDSTPQRISRAPRARFGKKRAARARSPPSALHRGGHGGRGRAVAGGAALLLERLLLPLLLLHGDGLYERRSRARARQRARGDSEEREREAVLCCAAHEVGEEAVALARTVLVKDIQPSDVVGGNPAKVLRKRALP